MVERKGLFKAWKESKSSLSFSEWKEQERITLNPESKEIILTKNPLRYSYCEDVKHRIKNWDEKMIKRNLYISRENYFKLKETKSISGQVNKILSDYFRNEKLKNDKEVENEQEQ